MPRPVPRRLEAFTVLELLVVLVISAVLFGLAYTALGAVQRQQQLIARKSATLAAISTWQAALAADFAAGSRVEVANDQVRCRHPHGSVRYTYSFPDSVLVREQGEIMDTFPLPIRECTYFWQGQPRTVGLIDEMALFGVAAQDTFSLQAATAYPAQQFVPPFAPTAP